MTLFRITRLGLGSIAILVAVLWGCLFTERALVRQSRLETYRAMRDLRYLKMRRSVAPAANPAPAPQAKPGRSTLG